MSNLTSEIIPFVLGKIERKASTRVFLLLPSPQAPGAEKCHIHYTREFRVWLSRLAVTSSHRHPCFVIPSSASENIEILHIRPHPAYLRLQRHSWSNLERYRVFSACSELSPLFPTKRRRMRTEMKPLNYLHNIPVLTTIKLVSEEP
jgi:hypothetical protein